MGHRTACGIEVTVQGPPGGSPPVVLVHGAADRGSSFRRLLRHLPDLRVAVYDRRGYGASVDLRPARSLADHAADLVQVLGITEVAGDQPVVVVAHSFGGHVAVLAAIDQPERVRGLGLWEPPVPWMDCWPAAPRDSLARIASGDDPGLVAERIAVAMSGRRAWERLSEEERAVRRREGATFCADIASEMEAPYDWADLGVPVLFGHGSATWPYSRDACANLAELVGQPEHEVEGATHVGHATHPEGFAGFVRASVRHAVGGPLGSAG